MTFEPLIHITPVMAILEALMWTALFTLAVLLLSYLLFYLPWKLFYDRLGKYGDRDGTEKMDRKKIVWFVTLVWAILGFLFIGTGMDSHRYYANIDTASQNITKKYDVEQVTFPPRPTGRSYSGPINYPEQSGPQPITVKSNGKTRMAILTQNESTSEPTLLDVDSGKPMDDIIRK